MDSDEPLVTGLSLVIGFVIGSISSGLGIGGGVFTVPYLYYIAPLYGITEPVPGAVASAGSLLLASVLSTSATIRNIRKNRIPIKLAIFLGAGTFPGAAIGANLAPYLTRTFLMVFFAFFVILGAAKSLRDLFIQKREQDPGQNPESRLPDWMAILPGIPVGIISSLTGLGGGVLMIPILQLVYKQKIRTAIIISNLCIVITAVSGVVSYGTAGTIPHQPGAFMTGYLNWSMMLPMVLGAIPGGYIGSMISDRIKNDRLVLVFAVLQIAIALKMIGQAIF